MLLIKLENGGYVNREAIVYLTIDTAFVDGDHELEISDADREAICLQRLVEMIDSEGELIWVNPAKISGISPSEVNGQESYYLLMSIPSCSIEVNSIAPLMA